MTWNNGSKYNGHWRDDKRDGQGVMIYDWGATYDGEWHDGYQYWDNSKYKIKTYNSGNFVTLYNVPICQDHLTHTVSLTPK